jgi:aspartyl-tRNA(Asn)/glutamyl-tRNA(Gln) amidotransferase subunit A
MNYISQPYVKIREKLLAGELSVSSIVSGHLDQIHTYNKALNAFLEVYEEDAMTRAALVDVKIKAGTAGKLAGLVVGIKDLLCYEGHHSYAGSKILESFKSSFSATAVQRLLDEDAIIIGRQNCDEFGMGSTNENSAYGAALNYANQAHVAGGSSGGSAVAVQAGMCQVSLGTDTGGSIRMPAAFCGVIGLKPTYGLVSRWGLIAYASSFDTIGPIANYVSDARLVLEIIKGDDGQDSSLSSSLPEAQSDKKRIAYIKEVVEHPSLQPQIKAAFEAQVENLKGLGYTVEAVDFPYIDQLLPTYYVLTTAESSSNLARFDGVKFGHRTANPVDLMQLYKRTRQEGFGEEVQRRIMLGTFVLSADYYDAYYTKAQKVRRLIQEKTLSILADYDFIISPTTSSTAYRVGEKTQDPIQMYLGDLFTVQANVAGVPGLSIPMGSDSTGLPMGFQLMTNPFQEGKMLDLGEKLYAYEG